MKIAVMLLLCVGFALSATQVTAAEKPVAITVEQVAEAVENAPDCRHIEGMDLNLRLIDFIDCGDPQDPHDMMDQGTSTVKISQIGDYRVTAAHRHAFFAYRFRSAGKDKPVLIVYQYPDNRERTINFSTHESGLSGRSNNDWSLETGVYTGGPLPLSKEMQHHTFIMWPQDEWPVAMVGNFHRYSHPAAASKIWIYAIEGGLPKLDVDPADKADQRKLGHFNSFAFLPTAFHFGLRSPNAVEHMLDYAEYIGVNELSWCVVANNTWGTWADVPSFPSTGDRGHLDKVLTAMDKRGGFSFAACIGPEGDVTINGKPYHDMKSKELKKAVFTFFDEFLDRYGKYKSLRAIGLGSQYGAHFAKRLDEEGILDDVVEHIKAKRPDIQVFVFLGGEGLHKQYFDGSGVSAESVYAAFEKGKEPWPQVLADKALKNWKTWKQDPEKWGKIKGLDIYEQYQPDDFRIFGLYSQQPREAMYYDLDNSQARSDLIDSPYAALWNTHFEGWFGLHPEVNFWYQKLWVAPDFNAPPPLSLAPFARAMGHRDRMAIMPGSWNNKYFGYEKAIRSFAKAFRSLPPEPMTNVADLPLDTVNVRWLAYKGKRYVSVLNLIPFESKVTVDGNEMQLAPYELVALSDDGDAAPVVTGKAPAKYQIWIGERMVRIAELSEQVKDLDADAAPEAYRKAADQATMMLMENAPYAADMHLGFGLISELQLRKDILDPPTLTAPRLSEAPPMNGDLDAWPAKASDLTADDGSYLAGHLYFPNSWGGAADLSARLRLGHDGEKLYIGAEICDDKLGALDSCDFRLSTNGAYLDWTEASRKSNLGWAITLPTGEDNVVEGKGAKGFTYTCRRTDTGYVVEGSAPLKDLGLSDDDNSMGFLMSLSDDDDTPNRNKAGWARKQVLMVPHKPNFTYWNDVRNCGKLVLGQ